MNMSRHSALPGLIVSTLILGFLQAFLLSEVNLQSVSTSEHCDILVVENRMQENMVSTESTGLQNMRLAGSSKQWGKPHSSPLQVWGTEHI